MAHLISPSILNADFGHLADVIDMLNESRSDWVHLDVMDGMFVPNISFGMPVVKLIKKHSTKPLDVHLMIVDPDRYIQDFKDAGADRLIVQYEACTHLHRTIQVIRQTGMKAAVALNPHTSVHLLEDILHDLDQVLIMTVNPGFGGQDFIPHSFEKIKQLRKMIDERNCNTLIEVDGGIDLSNISKLSDAGVDVFVVGSFIFKSDNPAATIEALKKA
ncbi:MAG TPA: ribulose-phosphate 3-epimerase [Bacteroidales bacterium]|nr:ribulose-phosphate 3-epimerase [Bacteroidales bacterium]